jgi:hypothetical protein
LVSRCSNPERHAVLALLSERYPPLKGRSPTRYSPVRHSTQGRSPFRVRLACVRHAASVDSEPGSNSQVKCLRERLGPHFACIASVLCSTVHTSILACARTSACRRLTLDGLVTRCGLAAVSNVCTLYLVFKEPRPQRLAPSGAPLRHRDLPAAAPIRDRLSSLCRACRSCQPLFSNFVEWALQDRSD